VQKAFKFIESGRIQFFAGWDCAMGML
jgi:hypothetical protein